MKKIWWTLFIFFYHLASMSQEYETQTYEVIKKIEDAEIRYYPAVMRIKTSQSNGFASLFGFISGKNSMGQKIAMTTPVYTHKNDGQQTMEFVLPKKFTPQNVPKSISEKVAVYQSKPGYYIAYTFGGYSFNWLTKKATQKLEEIIIKHQLSSVNNPLLLVYNSPYELMNRKNEILFELINYP